MGVEKTSTCQILKTNLPDSVFLDGDWCWDMHPFQVTPDWKYLFCIFGVSGLYGSICSVGWGGGIGTAY